MIGRFPNPIGGITIHNMRLAKRLQMDGYGYNIVDFGNGLFKGIFNVIISDKRIYHISITNTFLILLLILIIKLKRKKILLTIHTNIGRYNFFRSIIEIINIYLSDTPIVLNKKSYCISKKINNDTAIVSAFIPPLYNENNGFKSIHVLRYIDNSKWNNIYCTNASNVKIDKYGNEIYGITELVNIFKKKRNSLLIVSDPSGKYGEYFRKKKIDINYPNILFIGFPHSFIEILKFSDVFIRATSTDGDSLSVKEALFFDKIVIASDAVSRPKGCILYKFGDSRDLESKINNYQDTARFKNFKIENGYEDIRKIYLNMKGKPRQQPILKRKEVFELPTA